MTKEEYNKSRPNEKIIFEDAKIVVRLNIGKDDNEAHIFVHHKSVDGYEQLPLGYMLGSNALMFKTK